MLRRWLTVGLWLICHSHCILAEEHFNEKLHIRPLQDGRLYTNFVFKTLLDHAVPRSLDVLASEDRAQHYTVFPLALGQIIREYAVTELHLSLNAGKWDYAAWGYPDDPGVGSGAELWTWMGDNGDGSFKQRWQGLRNALAGLFCASLGELDERRSTSPVYAFHPDGDIPSNVPHRLIYANHPSEHICTENLTPFIKLLPCKSRSGIASLLNPHRLFDADWHGMSVRILWKKDLGVEVQLSVQAVFDPVRLWAQKKRDWSFIKVFERNIGAACPVAETSNILVDLPRNMAYSISPQPGLIVNDTAIYNVAETSKPLDIALNFEEKQFIYPLETTILAPISITRKHSGSSQARGIMHVTFTNSLEQAQRVVYLETPPWIIKFYLHTLTITSNDDSQPKNGILEEFTYIPSTGNLPTLLESTLLLPASSTVYLTLEFDKTFLRYTEHPPDAQRGWDLPAAVLVPMSSDNNNSAHPRMYTNTLLVDLATPDFSMPYNVIIMSCTLVALLFGSIFNLLTREFIAVKVD